MSNLKQGDFVTGDGIATGKYLGVEKVEAAGIEKKFHKVYDFSKQVCHYLPEGKDLNLYIIPSKKTYLKNLTIMENAGIIDVEEIEGNRYRYLKEKYSHGELKESLEVLHDLDLLSRTSKVSIAEKKLLNQIKEKLVSEVSFVFDVDSPEAESIIFSKTVH